MQYHSETSQVRVLVDNVKMSDILEAGCLSLKPPLFAFIHQPAIFADDGLDKHGGGWGLRKQTSLSLSPSSSLRSRAAWLGLCAIHKQASMVGTWLRARPHFHLIMRTPSCLRRLLNPFPLSKFPSLTQWERFPRPKPGALAYHRCPHLTGSCIPPVCSCNLYAPV